MGVTEKSGDKMERREVKGQPRVRMRERETDEYEILEIGLLLRFVSFSVI